MEKSKRPRIKVAVKNCVLVYTATPTKTNKQ